MNNIHNVSLVSSEECVNIIIFNDSLKRFSCSAVGVLNCLYVDFSNINVLSSHKEVVVCRSAAGAFGASLDLLFCQNCVFVNEKGMTPDSSGLLG